MKYKTVLVSFPFDDFSATKVRPAVCLSNAVGQYKYVILAFISSQLHNAESSDIILEQNKRAFVVTGRLFKMNKKIPCIFA